MSKKTQLLYKKLTCCLGKDLVKQDEPLKNHTSIKIGGKCPILVSPSNKEQLLLVLKLFKEYRQKYFIIGNGTNLLVKDTGTKYCIIKLGKNFTGCTVVEDEIEALSGTSLLKINKISIEHSLGGLEWSYGIPGTLGGAIYMNAGAYGGQMSDVVVQVSAFDGKTVRTFEKNQLKFAYRKSLFQFCPKFVIISARLKLKKGDQTQIEATCKNNMQKRKDSQPLNFPSAGSVFKRHKTLIASKTIDELGLKGFFVGGAQISTKHAGFIVNTGNATCTDVLKLVRHIQKKVHKIHKTKLQLEVKILGD